MFQNCGQDSLPGNQNESSNSLNELEIVSQPGDMTANQGDSVIFQVEVNKTGVTYEWYKGSSALANSNKKFLVISGAQASDVAIYHVRVSLNGETILSRFAKLSVQTPGGLVTPGVVPNPTATPTPLGWADKAFCAGSTVYDCLALGKESSGATTGFLDKGVTGPGYQQKSYLLYEQTAGYAPHLIQMTQKATTQKWYNFKMLVKPLQKTQFYIATCTGDCQGLNGNGVAIIRVDTTKIGTSVDFVSRVQIGSFVIDQTAANTYAQQLNDGWFLLKMRFQTNAADHIRSQVGYDTGLLGGGGNHTTVGLLIAGGELTAE